MTAAQVARTDAPREVRTLTEAVCLYMNGCLAGATGACLRG